MRGPARRLRAVRMSRLVGAAGVLWLAGCAGTSGAAPVDAAAVLVDPTAALVSACSGCHYPGGSAIVDLSSHSALQMERALLAYKHAADGPTAMHRMARGYTEAEIAAIARRLGR